MKVVALAGFDQAPQVTTIDKPEPGPGEVRVRVHAASVNGFDVAVADGMLRGAMDHRFPVVLGKDFAGTVDAVGDDVNGYDVGDRVFGVVTKEFLGDGAFGEYVTVPVAVGIAKLPESIGFDTAAGLGLAWTAALASYDAAGIAAGSTVLIVGATGGVGQQALQLAAHAGAEVIASAHSEDERAVVTRLGAAHVVDYSGDVAAEVREISPRGVDMVLHFAGDAGSLVPVLRDGGLLVSTLLQSPEQISAEGVTVVPVYANPSQGVLERLATNQVSGYTGVTVDRVVTLDETPRALADFADGTLGKIIVTIS